MPDTEVREEILQFGNGGRLLGMLTLPEYGFADGARPAFVFLSAGMLHRVGPSRLHVRLARRLARKGFPSLRLDLAGKGDSPARPGLSNQESVAADFSETLEVVEKKLGNRPLILAGLCSGADNAIRLSIHESRVVGMVLFDPICFPDSGFAIRALIGKYTNPARYLQWIKARLARGEHERPAKGARVDPMALRDLPTREQMTAAFEAIGKRGGQALSVFTQYALAYYNREGQLGKVLGVDGYAKFGTELFWPQSEHTYRLELHRRRLMNEVERWAVDAYVRGDRAA